MTNRDVLARWSRLSYIVIIKQRHGKKDRPGSRQHHCESQEELQVLICGLQTAESCDKCATVRLGWANRSCSPALTLIRVSPGLLWPKVNSVVTPGHSSGSLPGIRISLARCTERRLRSRTPGTPSHGTEKFTEGRGLGERGSVQQVD